VHRLVDRIFLGREYPEVHKWMDEPYRLLRGRHRILRHSPVEVIARFGFTDRALSGLLHIATDFAHKEVRRKFRSRKRK